MTSNPLGLMIQGQGLGGAQRTALLDHVKAANYATVSVLDDYQLCIDIKNALPDCVVVFRASDFVPEPGANAVASLFSFLGGIQSQDKRIVIMVNCENGFSQAYCSMWANMIVAIDSLGWKLCVGNVSSGSVKSGQGTDPNDWLNDAKYLLATLAKYPGHYLAAHEYTYPFAWSVSNGAYGDPANQPDKVDWSKPQWHIGRNVQGIVAACKALNLPAPQMIITECIIDTMGDIAARFGYKADGYKQLTDVWKKMFAGVDRGDVLADQHIWAWEKIYSSVGFVIGTHTYCYHDSSGQWGNYRVDDEPHYLARMEKYRSVPAPKIVTTETPAVKPITKPIAMPTIGDIAVSPAETSPQLVVSDSTTRGKNMADSPVGITPPVDVLPAPTAPAPFAFSLPVDNTILITADDADLAKRVSDWITKTILQDVEFVKSLKGVADVQFKHSDVSDAVAPVAAG